MENEVKKKRRSFRVPLKLSNAFDKEKLQPFIKLLKPKASSGFVCQKTPTTSFQEKVMQKEVGKLPQKVVKNVGEKTPTSATTALEQQLVIEKIPVLDENIEVSWKKKTELQSELKKLTSAQRWDLPVFCPLFFCISK